MKKIGYYVVIGIGLIFILILCLYAKDGRLSMDILKTDFIEAVNDAKKRQEEKLNYNSITYETFVNNGDAFIVVIERAGCGYCIQYMPIVEEVAKEKKIPLYYIDTDTLESSEMESLSTSNSYLKKNQWGTPTTLFMLGNRVLDAIGGYVEKDSVLAFLKDRVVMGE